MLGGVGSALLLVLIVFPAIFSVWRGWALPAMVPRPGEVGGFTTGDDNGP